MRSQAATCIRRTRLIADGPVALLSLILSVATGHATSFLIEAESLEVSGGLLPTRDHGRGARDFLWSPSSSPAPAAGAVELPHAGRWRLWVRSKDYPKDRPGIRNFTVRVGTKLEAVGTEIVVPPFTWRDLFVYVAAKIDECQSATLRYRVGNGPERRMTAERFPWEFSVRVDDMNAPVTWAVDVTLADGRVVAAP